ncbi:MAG: hypothetical protein HYT20_00910 [Candidatus Nealsonbacteria bacterium]|nr:hypothetical protein [Candidatus Nealsonbacteria bacterium]
MPHYCKYFIAHCIDFRFQEAIKDHLAKNGLLGDCDIISIAGGVKDRDFILKQLDVSVSLHKSREAVLINHIDCGAYGGSGKFSSFEAERIFHAKELEKTKTRILEKYPSLKVKIMLAKIQQSGKVTFEEIKA